ncbi:MAG TPA: helix-turn-helix domain-containing protein [Candidatus Paceibacterota bacterium]|nr:helix-turn-helix domain-containing protein [Candidatus Paceibacterota bacterium]
MPEAPQEITLKEAATATGYHPDYIGALLREGKIPGRKVGRSWVTTAAAIRAYGNKSYAPSITFGKLLLIGLAVLVALVVVLFLGNIFIVGTTTPVEESGDILNAGREVEDIGISLQ